MASKETTPSGSGSQESGNSSRTPWDTLGEFVHRIGNSFRDDDRVILIFLRLIQG